MQKLGIDAFRTARSRIIISPTVDNPAYWPKADTGKCCIFEAINMVGRAMHGDRWDNSELRALDWPMPPADAEELRLAELRKPVAVSKAPPPASITNVNYGQTPGRTSAPITRNYDSHVSARWQHEHANLVQGEQALWETNHAALARLLAATEWLAQQCRDKVINAFVRFQTGGMLSEMQFWEWNVDTPLFTFVASGGFNRWYVELNPPQQFPVFIFFERDAIARATATFEHAPSIIAETDLARFSPYLRLAVQLALAHNYTSRAQAETAPIREAHARQAWSAALPGVPESRTVMEAIAKVIGFPDIPAIKQGQRGAQIKKGAGSLKT